MRNGNLWLFGGLPLSIASILCGFAWQYLSLPEPRRADRGELLKWLVLRDLEQQDPQLQADLLDRLQEEFHQPQPDAGESDWEGGAEQLSPLLQARLERNLAFLQRFWFYHRAEQFAEIPETRRDAFLDAQIAFALRWEELAFEPSKHPGDNVFAMIDVWLAESEGERKVAAERVVRAAVVRFLETRSLEQYPLSMRLELARRIEQDFIRGARPLEFLETADRGERQRLHENAMLLFESWLTDEAQRYAELESSRRADWLDRRMEQFRRWRLGALLRLAEPADSGASADSSTVFSAFAGHAQTWLRRVDAESKPALELLLRDLSQRLLFQGL